MKDHLSLEAIKFNANFIPVLLYDNERMIADLVVNYGISSTYMLETP